MDTNVVSRLMMGALSPDNETRKQAENHIHQHLSKQPEALMAAVLKLLRQSNNPSVRMLCAVFLRQKLVNGEPILFRTLSDRLQSGFKSELLQAIVHERAGGVRRNISDTVAELAKILLFREDWGQLKSFLFKAIQSDREELRFASFDIMGKIADGTPERFGSATEQVVKAFEHGLKDKSLSVRVCAMVSEGKLISSVTGECKETQMTQSHIVGFLHVTQQAFQAEDEDLLGRAIQTLVDIATENPSWFEPKLETLSELCSKMGQATKMNDGLRSSCLEVLVGIAENEEIMARKYTKFLQHTVFLGMKLMMEVSHDPQWVLKDHEAERGKDGNNEYANLAMDRFALAIGGRKLKPIIFPMISNCVSQKDWKMRRAGLMTLSQVAEVVELKDLPVPKVCEFLKDPHPQVRHAAANCIGQISNDHEPMVQERFHKLIIPQLLHLTIDNRAPRIQVHAAAALFNFVENCEEKILEGYADTIIVELVKVLKSGSRSVQEQVLTTIACVSGAAPKCFQKHFENVAGLVMYILTNTNGKEYERLRARSMECISYIGMSVGPEKFGPYAANLMKLFGSMIDKGFAPDDTTRQYMLQAWTRIATVMKKGFTPYLKYVIPEVFKVAERKLEFENLNVSGGSTLGLIGLTSSLEEKATACAMLCSFANDIKEGYFPYVEATVKVMLPLMEYYLNDEVRKCAVSIMPTLLEITISAVKERKANETFLYNMFSTVTKKMLECTDREPDTEVLMDFVAGIQKCIQMAKPLGRKCINQDALEIIGKALLNLLGKSMQKIENLEKRKMRKDIDEEAVEKLDMKAEQEDHLSFMAADCIGTLIKSHRQAFLGTFDKLGRAIMLMLHPSRTALTRKYAVFIIDDLIEFIGADSGKYFRKIIPPLLRYAKDKDPALQQACVYGLAVSAEHGGETFNNYVNQSLKTLGEAITTNRKIPNATDDVKSATDNAISAFAKTCKFRGSRIDLSKALPAFLHWLPLEVDESEAGNVYSIFCSLVESNNKHLLGENMNFLPQVVKILVMVCGTTMIDQNMTGRMMRLVVNINKRIPKNALQALKARLPGPVKEKMAKILAHCNK
mmetsp:Transcript_34654/g.48371  ORF Transcript_34654/g.48371 Transcript_34654/m.48371 type:complete len:1079 (+) Transcript_34654:78-3314(+)